MVYALVVLFLLVFASGFLPGNRKLFLIPLLAFFVLGVTLIVLTLTSDSQGTLRMFLILTGASSVLFSVGVVYGVLGIMGYYQINNPIYIGTVIVSVLGFVSGAIGALLLSSRTSDFL